MVTTLSTALNTFPSNLAVSAASAVSDCMVVSVYFTGKYSPSVLLSVYLLVKYNTSDCMLVSVYFTGKYSLSELMSVVD